LTSLFITSSPLPISTPTDIKGLLCHTNAAFLLLYSCPLLNLRITNTWKIQSCIEPHNWMQTPARRSEFLSIQPNCAGFLRHTWRYPTLNHPLTQITKPGYQPIWNKQCYFDSGSVPQQPAAAVRFTSGEDRKSPVVRKWVCYLLFDHELIWF
jgi:hypothetical protein